MITKNGTATIAQSQTDAVVVGAVAGKRVRVTALAVLAGATATDLTFGSKIGAAATVAISPLLANNARVPFVLPHNPDGWFETEIGAALVALTGAGASSGILLSYHLI